MDNDDPLVTLLDMAERHVRHALVVLGVDELVPLFHLCGPNNENYLIPTRFTGEESKRKTARAMAHMIRRHSIVRYSFMSEAWMIVRPPGWEEGTGPRPSEADDRVEVVVAFATDGVTFKSRHWRIKRHEGKCIDLVLEPTDSETPGRDRFGNLFTKH